MGRRGKGGRGEDWLHGAFVIDKPAGMSSAAVVTQVRRRLGVRSIGHTGTLDPMASGVLPLVVGQATKLAGYLLAGDKAYDATVRLGVETDTLDREGVVTATADPAALAAIDAPRLAAALAVRRGAQAQVAPAVSAIKQGGRRLYERVRDGEAVAPPVRDVQIHTLELRGVALPAFDIHVACSKGTFIRALARDVGHDLGVGAHLTALRRVRSGRFTLAEAVAPERIDRDTAPACLVPLAEVADLPRVPVDDAFAVEVEHGRRHPPPNACCSLEAKVFQLVAPDGWVIAVAHVDPEDGLLRYDRVLRRDGFEARYAKPALQP